MQIDSPASEARSPIRWSWRREVGQEARARRARRIKRLAAASVCAALLAWLAYLLLAPFWHPNSYLLYGVASGYHPGEAPPLNFAWDDYAQLGPAQSAFVRARGTPSSLRLALLDAPEDLALQLEDLRHGALSSGDVVMIQIRAHGVVLDGEALLVCSDFRASNRDVGVLPLTDLLRDVRALRGTKVLLLDSGNFTHDPRLGMVVNEFPRYVRDRVWETGDRSLWVLAAHGPLEHSHDSPALRQSVFGFFLGQGLQGAADLDRNQSVDLGELWRYVSVNVSDWVQQSTGGAQRQTPELIWGGGRAPARFPTLVSVAGIPQSAVADDPAQAVARAQDPKRQFTLATMARRYVAYQVTAQADRHRRQLLASVQLDPRGVEAIRRVQSRTTLPGASGETPTSQTPAADGAAPTDGAAAGPGQGQGAEGEGGQAQDEQADAEARQQAAQAAAAAEFAALVGEAWRLRDALESRQNGVPSPVDYAPLLWRAAVAEIVGYDRLTRAGTVTDLRPHLTALRDLVESLRDASQGKPPRNRRRQNTVDLCMQLRPPANDNELFMTLGIIPAQSPMGSAVAAGQISGQGEGAEASPQTGGNGNAASNGPAGGNAPTANPSNANAPDGNASSSSNGGAPNGGSSGTAAQEAPAGGAAAAGSVPAGGDAARGAGAAAQVRRAWDTLLGLNSRAALARWMAESWQPQYEDYDEFRFARRLANDLEVPWETVRLALTTRRTSHRVAWHPLCADGWGSEKILAADRLRVEGERLLADRIGADWNARASQLLQRAEALYRSVESELAAIEQATHLYHDVLHRFPYYLAWRRATRGATSAAAAEIPQPEQLESLRGKALALGRLLAAAGQTPMDDLLRAESELRSMVDEVESGLSPDAIAALVASPVSPGDSWRIAALLDTPLPSAEARQQLAAALTPLDMQLASTFAINRAPSEPRHPQRLAPDQWEWLERQLQLECAWTGLSRVMAAAQLPDADRAALTGEEVPGAGHNVPSPEDATDGAEQIGASPVEDATADPIDRSESPTTSDGRLWQRYRRAGRALSQFYQALPSTISNIQIGTPDLRDDATRGEKLARLRDAWHDLRLVDPRDARPFGNLPWSALLREARQYDLLRWNRQRIAALVADAPEAERVELRAWASRIRRQALTLSRQPPLADLAAPSLAWEGAPELSLSGRDAAPTTLTLQSLAAQPQSVWLVFEYDRDLVEISLPNDRPIYLADSLRAELRGKADEAAVQSEMSVPGSPANGHAAAVKSAQQAEQLRELLARAAEYPQRPDLAELPPSLLLDGRQSISLPLEVRRKAPGTDSQAAPPAGRTRIIVRAITSDAYVRHELDVLLPARESVSLAVVTRAENWRQTPTGAILHPMPNRRMTFPLQLINGGERPVVVDVELLVPQENRGVPVPEGSLTAEAARTVLDQLGPLAVWKELSGIEIPPGGRAPLAVPASEKEGDGGAGQAAGGAESSANGDGSTAPDAADSSGQQAAGSDAGGAGEDESDKPPPVRLMHGLLAVLTDRDSGRVLIKHLEFSPQRPRRYVRAEVGYNLAAERIEIRVTPRNRDQVPAEGIRVECEFAEALPRGRPRRLLGVIQPPDYEAFLYASVPPSHSAVYTAMLTIDDFPRAMIFRVPCGATLSRVPEDTNVMAARIVRPLSHAYFPAPQASIPVVVQIDAPVGAFPPERNTDFVEIGVDADRDREFRGETTLRFSADRMVNVLAHELTEAGQLVIEAQVGDFDVSVPSEGLRDVRANLLARVVAGGKAAWSEPVPVSLDATAPEVERIELVPGRGVAVDQELVVSVWANDRGMSGVQTVEVGLDTTGAGDFPPDAPPLAAERKSNFRWEAALKLDKLTPGTASLLIRATDRAGNVGPVRHEYLRILPAASDEPTQKLGRIRGTVTYGQEKLAGADVTLRPAEPPGGVPLEPRQTKTDADGRFVFEQVPPGKYVVSARALTRNKPRTDEAEVEITDVSRLADAIRLDVR